MDEDISLSIYIQSYFKTSKIRSSASIDSNEKSGYFLESALVIIKNVKT